MIVRDVLLADPAPGDVIVTPATGAYGYAMANNYNGVPRPPVIFCRDGDARVVVRRETSTTCAARVTSAELGARRRFRVGLLGHGTVGSARSRRCCPSRPRGSSVLTGLRPELAAC